MKSFLRTLWGYVFKSAKYRRLEKTATKTYEDLISALEQISVLQEGLERAMSDNRLLRSWAEGAPKYKMLAFLLDSLPTDFQNKILTFLPSSKSQLGQDLFALALSGGKSDGYFVEFGATDGIVMSNTLFLEQAFGWKGILAEPARLYSDNLRLNRNAAVDNRCVWIKSKEEISFFEVGELSTIGLFSNRDHLGEARVAQKQYLVETVSLLDLLDQHDAPSFIDFISIDTEGSELEIIEAFDFSKYSFGFISIEHNFTNSRDQIFELLSKAGYARVFAEFSQFDDWYVPINQAASLGFDDGNN